jgi:hypothetical protein
MTIRGDHHRRIKSFGGTLNFSQFTQVFSRFTQVSRVAPISASSAMNVAGALVPV